MGHHARFWTHVHPQPSEKGCWLWAGSKDSPGAYGLFWDGYKLQKAHRWFWTEINGPVGEGLELDHSCRVHHCVNPDHLEAVTHKVNMSRGAHALKTQCPLGHPYSPENTYVYSGNRRACRICRHRWATEYRKAH